MKESPVSICFRDVVSRDHRNLQEFKMTRLARDIHPSLDEFDTKTLLSAGQLAHLVGGSQGALLVPSQRYYNYINVNTSGFTAKDVKWELFGQKELGRPDVKLEAGTIKILGGTPVPIASKETSSSSFPGLFKFEYKVGDRIVHAQAYGTSWNRIGQQPQIPTYTLPPPR
jgi:hypothetical protein